MIHLGHTRSVVKREYALLTPDTFVRAPLPGYENATNIVHVGPQLGAAFAQHTVELQPGGRFGRAPRGVSRFVYVVRGELELNAEGHDRTLGAGEYAYLPPDHPHALSARQAATASVFEKRYEAWPDAGDPWVVTGRESEALSRSLGDGLVARILLPEHHAFDFAVTTMTYDPGATLPFVEVHSMEHGLLMLHGEGLYLLGQDHHPVREGDVIYMAPYCPQWMAGVGGTQAKYLLYKDWNRHPLGN